MASSSVEKILEQIYENISETNEKLEGIAVKLSLIELRQSNGNGEMNDSIRAVNDYARAESSGCPEKALQVVRENFKAGHTATYHEQFLAKDDRSAEYELVLFFEKV